MSDETVTVTHEPGPNEMRDPVMRAEFRRATVWFGLAIAVALVVILIQPLLLIFAALVFASMLDGGARLIGKFAPAIPRGLRLLIVVALAVAFAFLVFYQTGVQIAQQAEELRATLMTQGARVVHRAQQVGVITGNTDFTGLVQQGMGSIGRVTSWVGSALGAFASLLMVFSIGLFIAMDPRIYERGLQWMVPIENRDDFSITLGRMGMVMRRLLAGRLVGMLFEGVVTAIFLWFAGVPMALLLGIITGMLAFIPNIGAFLSGVLMVSVGFSAGVEQGLWAIAIYFGVQTFDGYVTIPLVAKHTVDLPPALTLSAQILASTLFGVVGLALADPMVAMIKVMLERESELAARAGFRRPSFRRRRGVKVADPKEDADRPPQPTF